MTTTRPPFPAKNPWHYALASTALQFLHLLADGPGNPLVFATAPGIGRTTFLQHDMADAAKALGWSPAYWPCRDALEGPAAYFAAAAKEIAIATGVAASTLEEPENPLLRLSYWLRRATEAAGPGRILLLVDDLQVLMAHPQGIDVLSALRSAMTVLGGHKITGIFSTQAPSGAPSAIDGAKAPFLGFALRVPFPHPQPPFFQHLSTRFLALASDDLRKRVLLRYEDLLPAYLSELSAAFGHRPGALIATLEQALASANDDLGAIAMQQRSRSLLDNEQSRALWSACKPLERAVLKRIALHEPIFTKDALRGYPRRGRTPKSKTQLGSVQHALRALVSNGTVIKAAGRGAYRVADTGFAEFLRNA